jgi:hypothetical protein
MPAQEMITTALQGGIGSVRRICGIRRGSQVAGKTQTKREMMTVAAIAIASPAS